MGKWKVLVLEDGKSSFVALKHELVYIGCGYNLIVYTDTKICASKVVESDSKLILAYF